MPYIKINGIPQRSGPGVYSITNRVNGKVYVGSAISIKGRLLYHRSYLRRGKHDNKYLQRSWDKYGEKVFRFDLLEVCRVEKILEREQYWIDSLNTLDRSSGYNICPVAGSAMAGRNHTQASKDKMSERRKGMDTSRATAAAALVNRGRKLTEEQCRQRSESRKGVPKSEAHKEAIKKTHWTKGPNASEIMSRVLANRPKGLTPEHRRKISLAGRRRWLEYRILHSK